MRECPQCKGTGILNVKVTQPGKPESSFEMSCTTCDGKTVVTERVYNTYQASLDVWCDCGNPSSDVDYVEDTPELKHHWNCGDCGKLVQVG